MSEAETKPTRGKTWHAVMGALALCAIVGVLIVWLVRHYPVIAIIIAALSVGLGPLALLRK